MKKDFWKSIAPYAVAVVLFLSFAIVYCSPLLDGKVLYAGDTMNWKGAAHEAQEYYQQTGEVTWWTNSMFGGMPTYQITGSMQTGMMRKSIVKALYVGFDGQMESIGLIFAYFVGFFLMLICFGVNPWLSLIGGLAMGMSSYFFLIIPAGHMTKATAIGFLAPVIGGFYAIMRQKYRLGIPLILLYGILGITLHPQMTYYIALLIGVLAIAELYIHIRDKRWKDLGISVGILAACMALLIGAHLSWWQMNNSYLKHTMRGGHSELTKGQGNEGQAAKDVGLDIEYATAWSYGRGETMTLLIPNWEGGASGYDLGKDSHLSQVMRKQGVDKRTAEQFCSHAPTYRGEKAFTSGAVYVGAVVCLLFVLGLLVVPGAYKWALLTATLLSIMLAWGKNFMPLTELFFNHFPMYNKFRAVESILVVAEITIPLLGFMGLQRIVAGEVEWRKLRSSLLIAGGVTAGLCLFAALFAGSFDVTSSYDANWKSQVPQWLYDAILDERVAMIKADAWRSLLFVALGFVLTLWYAWQQNQGKLQKKHAILLYAGMTILVIADMMPIDKRFFNNDNFVKAKDSETSFRTQPWEEQILKDKSLDFRVMNLTANTFNDARTSYRLKSIGGYSAVKLRRYQDLIDEHISKMNMNVLNMLNTKYFVTRQGVMPNPEAMGNAWFVDEVQFVATPDEECAALNTLDLRYTAVADALFSKALTCQAQPDDADRIALTEYQPNRLTYSASCLADRVAVFSEIYYPDEWHLYCDGEELPIGRVNYTLRGAIIPAGEHTLTMEFVPNALKTDSWSLAIIILCLLLSAGLVVYPITQKKRA